MWDTLLSRVSHAGVRQQRVWAGRREEARLPPIPLRPRAQIGRQLQDPGRRARRRAGQEEVRSQPISTSRLFAELLARPHEPRPLRAGSMDRVSIVLTSREAAGGRIAGVTHVAGVEDGHGPIFDAGAFARQRTGRWAPQRSPQPTLSPAPTHEPHEPHRGRLHVAHVQQTGLALRAMCG